MTKIAQRFWTTEEDATILRMTAEGIGRDEIGRVLDRTAKAVSRRREVLKCGEGGKYQDRWQPDHLTRLKTLWADGVSAGDIAKKLLFEFTIAYSRSAVIGKVHRMGLSALGRGPAAALSPGARKVRVVTPRPKPKPRQRTATTIAMTPAVAPAYTGASLPPWKPSHRVERAPMATMETIKRGLCKWPIGDPKAPDFGFCGCRVPVTETYCAEHVAVAYQPPNRKQMEARIERAKMSYPQ